MAAAVLQKVVRDCPRFGSGTVYPYLIPGISDHPSSACEQFAVERRYCVALCADGKSTPPIPQFGFGSSASHGVVIRSMMDAMARRGMRLIPSMTVGVHSIHC